MRKSHNVLTNVGRNWVRDLFRVTTYANVVGAGHFDTADVKTNQRPMYIGLGVGGAGGVGWLRARFF